MVIEYRVNCVSARAIDFPVTVDTRYVVASLDTYREYAQPLRKTELLRGSEAWLQRTDHPVMSGCFPFVLGSSQHYSLTVRH
jgi:hypothetical protein